MSIDNLGDIQGLCDIKNIVETLKNLDKKSLIQTHTKFLEEISSLTGMYLHQLRVLIYLPHFTKLYS